MQMRKMFRFLLVTTVLLAGAVCGYAQKKDSPQAKENMLRYRYIDRESRKVRFDTTRTFLERMYLFAGSSMRDSTRSVTTLRALAMLLETASVQAGGRPRSTAWRCRWATR
jgi:hypothetical protein